MIFGGPEGDDAAYFDDDDYAYRRQRKAKMHSRKMTAISYDTAKRKSKVVGNPLQPVLAEKGRPPSQSMTRAKRLALQSSAKADLQLAEMYQNTVDEFKRKLTEQKNEAMLQRVAAIGSAKQGEGKSKSHAKTQHHSKKKKQ